MSSFLLPTVLASLAALASSDARAQSSDRMYGGFPQVERACEGLLAKHPKIQILTQLVTIEVGADRDSGKYGETSGPSVTWSFKKPPKRERLEKYVKLELEQMAKQLASSMPKNVVYAVIDQPVSLPELVEGQQTASLSITTRYVPYPYACGMEPGYAERLVAAAKGAAGELPKPPTPQDPNEIPMPACPINGKEPALADDQSVKQARVEGREICDFPTSPVPPAHVTEIKISGMRRELTDVSLSVDDMIQPGIWPAGVPSLIQRFEGHWALGAKFKENRIWCDTKARELWSGPTIGESPAHILGLCQVDRRSLPGAELLGLDLRVRAPIDFSGVVEFKSAVEFSSDEQCARYLAGIPPIAPWSERLDGTSGNSPGELNVIWDARIDLSCARGKNGASFILTTVSLPRTSEGKK